MLGQRRFRSTPYAFVLLTLLVGPLVTACADAERRVETDHAEAPEGTVSAAEAAPAPPQPVARCEDAGTTLDMRICLSEELTRVEARLAAVTDSIQAELPEKIDEHLSRAGADCRAYAEAECEAAALPYEGGTMVPLVVLGCRLDLANQRLTMLRSLYWNSLDGMPTAPPSS